MNLYGTFTNAGVRTYDITESTDGSVEIALGGGGIASVEPTGEGAGWQFTVREADDTLNRDEWVTDLHWLAREIGQLYRHSRV